jgi:hypothetical protein
LKLEAGRIDKSVAGGERERERERGKSKYVNVSDMKGERCYIEGQARGKEGGL